MATAAERPGDPGRLEKLTTPNRTHGAAQAAGAARTAKRGARGRSAWVCAPRGSSEPDRAQTSAEGGSARHEHHNQHSGAGAERVWGRAAIAVIAGIVALGPGIFWIFLVVAGIVGLVRSFTWLRPERATPPQQ